VCREEEGVQLIKEMKVRFSATVSTSSRGLIRAADINSPIELVSQAMYNIYHVCKFNATLSFTLHMISSKKVV